MRPRFDYPFPAAPLSPKACADVDARLVDLEQDFALFGARAQLLPLCRVFLTHCSPPEPRGEALALMTRFLYLVMYFADRVNPGRVGEDAAQVLRALAGEGAEHADEAAASGVARLAGAIGRELGRLLSAAGADPTSFFHLFRVNLGTFVWAAAPPPPPVDWETHMSFRTESICAVAYLRLWGLLEGLTPAHETRFAFLFQEMETWSARVQALANDLRSADRDARDGTPNAVALTLRARACSRAEAEDVVVAAHDEAVRRLQASMERARSFLEPGDSIPARYIDFIGICTRGNESAMQDLVERYRTRSSG